jgi:hypothetical protein
MKTEGGAEIILSLYIEHRSDLRVVFENTL